MVKQSCLNAAKAGLSSSATSAIHSPELLQSLIQEIINTTAIADRKSTQAEQLLPLKRLLRLSQIIGDPNANPPVPALIPICRSAWWSGVKSGRYPKSIKLSPRVTVWRAEDIAALIARLREGGEA